MSNNFSLIIIIVSHTPVPTPTPTPSVTPTLQQMNASIGSNNAGAVGNNANLANPCVVSI